MLAFSTFRVDPVLGGLVVIDQRAITLMISICPPTFFRSLSATLSRGQGPIGP
jgi:hypothetical protein